MTNLDRKTTILLHIQKYCKEIEENLNFFGSNFNTFETNNIFRDSISMKIFQIGELAKELDKVDKEYINETKSNIPWQSIIRMRERFAHHYGEMDLKMIFNTAINDIPVLKNLLEKELAKLMED
ncbi:MAG: DUF86 domain-containing protein [Clostridia bacterium]|nr:DUF86 domain-containing protein [Clostridia bacterium]